MQVKFYPKPDGSGYTIDELQRNELWLYADVTCPHCGKEQPIAATQYVGGPCCRCGKLTNKSE